MGTISKQLLMAKWDSMPSSFFIKAILNTLNRRDPYTAGHLDRVADLAVLIGKHIGADTHQLKELYIGGLLHDIGKIGVSLDLLLKSTALTDWEFDIIKGHAQIGFNILKNVNVPWIVKDIVLNHHEKLDGSGYPNGLYGKEINFNVRIITVSDVVDAMSTTRPYRAARSSIEVIQELYQGKGIKYDANVVDTIVDLIKMKAYNPWKASIEVKNAGY